MDFIQDWHPVLLNHVIFACKTHFVSGSKEEQKALCGFFLLSLKVAFFFEMGKLSSRQYDDVHVTVAVWK